MPDIWRKRSDPIWVKVDFEHLYDTKWLCIVRFSAHFCPIISCFRSTVSESSNFAEEFEVCFKFLSWKETIMNLAVLHIYNIFIFFQISQEKAQILRVVFSESSNSVEQHKIRFQLLVWKILGVKLAVLYFRVRHITFDIIKHNFCCYAATNLGTWFFESSNLGA